MRKRPNHAPIRHSKSARAIRDIKSSENSNQAVEQTNPDHARERLLISSGPKDA